MTLQRSRRRAKLIIAAGVVLALVAGFTVFALLQRGGTNPAEQGTPMRDVVIAVQDITQRQPIEAAHVAVRSVPADDTNVHALVNPADVIGRVSHVPIPAGQVITSNLLASTATNGFEVGGGEEPDPNGPHLRAVSVMVPADRAAGGTIDAGQRVDLIVTLPIENVAETAETEATGDAATTALAGPSTKTTLQNVTVLSRESDIYILNADIAMAEEIAETQAAGGQFTLVLRPDGDDRTAETGGSTLDDLIERYNFPIPEPANPNGGNPAAVSP